MASNRRPPDSTLVVVIGLLLVFGLVLLSSASSVISFQRFGDVNHLLKQQLVSAAVGVVAFLVMARIPYRRWRTLAFPLFSISMVLLVLVLIPGIGVSLNGARRWISIGGFLFQPVEVTKILLIFYLAAWFEQRGRKVTEFSAGFLPFIILLGTMTLLVMLQPDLGSMTVLTIAALVIYFVAGAPLPYFGLFFAGAASLLALLVKVAPYRAARFTIFLNPELDPQGIGYHVNQALLAIGSGGILGLGLGHSRQKFNFLPEASSDSIFAVAAEELGFIGVLMLLALFVAFMLRGFSIARRSPDPFTRYVAAGITGWISFQAFLNIAALTRLVPLTGIPLPFVSYGGTALVTTLAAVGVLVSISRDARAEGGH